jgi:tRNA wybutosine-synthesizing protein 1
MPSLADEPGALQGGLFGAFGKPFLSANSTVFTEILGLWHEYRTLVFTAIAVAAVLYKCLGSLRTLLHQETQSIGATIAAQKLNGTVVDSQPALKIAEKVSNYTEIVEPKVDAPRLKAKVEPKRVSGKKRGSPTRFGKSSRHITKPQNEKDLESDIQICIFYASLTGSTTSYVEKFKNDLFSDKEGIYPKLSIPTPSNSLPGIAPSRNILPPQLFNLEEIELDDYFVSLPTPPEGKSVKYIYIVVVPSYETDSPVAAFLDHLQETHHDFRIDSAPLSPLAGFSVFGFGDSSEWPESEGKFCQDAVQVDKWLGKLSGGRAGSRRLFPLGMGDMNPASSADGQGTAAANFREWRIHLEDSMQEYFETGEMSAGADLRGAVESGDEDSDVDVAEDETEKDMMDLEDLGTMIKRNPTIKKSSTPAKVYLPVDFTTPAGKLALEAGEGQSPLRKDMVPKDSVTYKALTKQGYAIVGSHSGVKICRWTKSALRGRGSCYKYSFYGIRSHLCMETTPSLSCSNKCVFCWRHGTNPVGTTWRWKVDPPEEIFKGVVEGHYRKIKMMKGVPGVRADRFSEAFRIRHCALSLVGEPIFYPYINEFLALLHGSQISSFLVCNAQHPAQLRALGPVTQLYVSIDASNKESLKKIDKPLHRDFWERFQECLDILREKRNKQRTVFRLTLVKGFNLEDEVKGYADLVERALPGFVEIKGVTYCGTSSAGEAGLTMGNVPFWEEVQTFVEALNTELNARRLDYGIAAEHQHRFVYPHKGFLESLLMVILVAVLLSPPSVSTSTESGILSSTTSDSLSFSRREGSSVPRSTLGSLPPSGLTGVTVVSTRRTRECTGKERDRRRRLKLNLEDVVRMFLKSF